jgi:hypothetical protein
MNIPPGGLEGLHGPPVGWRDRKVLSLKWERFSIYRPASDWTMPFGDLWSRCERQRFNLSERSTAPGA